MWWLIKTCVSVVALVALAYTVFFVPIAGRTPYGYAQTLWQSNFVQDKLREVRSDVHDELAQKLTDKDAAPRRSAKAGPKDELTDADRKGLDELLSKSIK